MSNKHPILLAIALALLLPAKVHAVAYCALRDPVDTIYELFSEADSYRSSVKTVGRDARQRVLEALPISMHFNELGRHTLYIAQKGDRVLGYVHARSEMSEWGLTEYAWAISPSMEVLGVKIQRSRDPNVRRKKSSELSQTVAGKDLAALRKLYDHAQVTGDKFAQNLLGSAMKTLVITRSVWREEVDPVGVQDVAQRIFPNFQYSKRVADLYDAEVLEGLRSLDMTKSSVFARAELDGYKIYDTEGRSLGLITYTPFDLDDPHRKLFWAAAPSGEIVAVYNGSTDGDDPDFESIIGFTPQHPKDCSSLIELAALEVATLARHHLAD